MAKSESSRATVPSNDAAKPAARTPWILNRSADILLVIAAPIPIFLLITGASTIWSAQAVSAFVMVWAIGHHLPGMMRAYGDPDLFRRFWLRFTIAPVLLIGVCAWSFSKGLYGVHVIAGIWGWWHYLMQTYGFVRIYDAKIGSFATVTRWLDWAMCLIWFAAAIILNDNTTYGFLLRFYNSGLSIPSAQAMQNLRVFTLSAASIITILFFGNLIYQWRQGRRTSLIKVALMLTTFAYFWYSTATVSNIVVAYAYFELFHDVQYLTIVWAFNRNRVNKDPNLGGFTRFLFRPRTILIGAYIALVCGYGLLNYGSQRVSDESARNLLLGVFLASTLLHYYFDGFIWKMREKKTHSTLDIESNETASFNAFSIPGWLRHALLWLVFVIPLAYMTWAQGKFQADPIADSQQIRDCVPESISALYDHGLALEASGNIDEAMNYYREAQSRAAHHGPSRSRLLKIHNRRGFHYMQHGNDEAALREFEASLEIDPDQIDIKMLVKRI